MSDLGTMVAEIRSEIRRTNFDNAIKIGICAAVQEHRAKRLSFNEKSFTFITVADQETYGVADSSYLGRVARFDSIKVTSPETVLNARDIDFIRDQISDLTGTPSDYAYYENNLYLNPVPNAVFTIDVLAVLELLDTAQSTANQIMSRSNILSLPTDYTNAWFTDGYEIIKAWAKGYVNFHNLRNSDEGNVMGALNKTFLQTQEDQLNSRGGSGFVTPTRF